jgi:nitroreductase
MITTEKMADPQHPKVARTDHHVIDLIRRRWSPRAFDPDRDVSPTDLRRLFEAARWAPSSRNEQPWRFVVAHRRRSPDGFSALLQSLGGRNQAWAAAAPVLVLVVVRLTHEADDVLNSHAWYDAGQGVAFLTLQATAMGLSVRQMQGFRRDVARTACGVPEPFEAAVVMAIGHAGSPDALTVDLHREDELAPRHRRSLDDLVFDRVWGRRFE